MARILLAISSVLALVVQSEAASRFDEVDLDENGAISFNEFLYHAETLPTMQESSLTKAQLKNTLKVLFLNHDKDQNLELNLK